MFIEYIDTATVAAFQVGYENPSQCSREYSCLFGGPLLRDIKNLCKMSPAEKAFEFEEAR